MELVYLWVEDYKNIHQEGFNFSPRFNCKYEPESKELIIEENKDFIPDFFGENINVTAIVGKNGSGKSSVLEIISLIYLQAKDKNKNEKNVAFLLQYDNEEFNFLYLGKDIEIETKPEITRGKGIFCEQLLYQPSLNLMSSSWKSYISEFLQKHDAHIYDLETKPTQLNLFVFPSKKDKKIDIFRNEIISLQNMFRVDKSIRKDVHEALKSQKLDFVPNKLSLSIDKNELFEHIIDLNIKEHWKDKEFSLEKKFFYKIFLMIVFSNITIDYKSGKRTLKQYMIEDDNIVKYFDNLFEEHNDMTLFIKKLDEDIDTFIKQTDNKSIENILKKENLVNNEVRYLAKLIDFMNEKNIDNLDLEKADDNLIERLLPIVPRFFKIDLEDSNNVLFSDFSTGEQYIISLLYSVIFYIQLLHNKNENINLYIDEFESGLHPKWQKEILFILLKVLKKTKLKINLFIATHSPFLLSDIPKQNIIFLDTDENGNCKVVEGLKDKKQTFGANIHTLLSDSFFMEDGLMGEFAKNKIQEIMDLLNNKKTIDEISIKEEDIKKVIEAIGEPFLGNKLLQMYYHKFKDAGLKEQRKQELLAQQKSIEEELKRL